MALDDVLELARKDADIKERVLSARRDALRELEREVKQLQAEWEEAATTYDELERILHPERWE
jgi:hypothetical protein